MSIMHTPDTIGLTAIYTDEDGKELPRKVLGWDKEGRPLVFCGDRLFPASTAPFARYQNFVALERPTVIDAAAFKDAVTDGVDTIVRHFEWENDLADILSTAIRKAVENHLSSKTN